MGRDKAMSDTIYPVTCPECGLREAVIPDGKHLAPELLVRPRKALRGKYPVTEK